ncbi:hypothetical protein HDV00_007838 [Rhizophlyctis rosea]|nr:hypothetical protein HDV00_007838 [Rhizophlyctis rosea]
MSSQTSVQKTQEVPPLFLGPNQLAQNAFFAMHRPLALPEAKSSAGVHSYPVIEQNLAGLLATPVTSSEAADVGPAQSSDEYIAQYNDEYAKLFNSFTCFAPPTTAHTDSSPYLPHPTDFSIPSSASHPFQTTPATINPEENPVLSQIHAQLQAMGLPSTLTPPHLPSTPIDYETDILSRLFKGDQGSTPSTAIGDQMEGVEIALPPSKNEVMQARTLVRKFNIMKIRKTKMNIHKWKKRSRAVRYSTRYNKSRRKHQGPQRIKQE